MGTTYIHSWMTASQRPIWIKWDANISVICWRILVIFCDLVFFSHRLRVLWFEDSEIGSNVLLAHVAIQLVVPDWTRSSEHHCHVRLDSHHQCRSLVIVIHGVICSTKNLIPRQLPIMKLTWQLSCFKSPCYQFMSQTCFKLPTKVQTAFWYVNATVLMNTNHILCLLYGWMLYAQHHHCVMHISHNIPNLKCHQAGVSLPRFPGGLPSSFGTMTNRPISKET